MGCPHCAFDCKPDGVDMTLRILYHTLSILPKQTYVTLGGGEPTDYIHWKEVLNIVRHDVNNYQSKLQWSVVTNGMYPNAVKEILSILTLAQAKGKPEVFSPALSNDQFHNPHPVSLTLFKALPFPQPIKTPDKKPTPMGRAKDQPWSDTTYRCLCPYTFINTQGDIFPCMCPSAPQHSHVYDYTQQKPLSPQRGCCRVLNV